MCGVAGILDLSGAPVDPAPVRRMLDSIAHRGPDGEGLLELGPLVLGHRRLAILDLSERSAQPMQLPERQLALSYNGEVYDYLELRAELEQAGERFTSEGDTEVVLRAYARWGVDAFARMNGMWGLALWDGARRRLVLSRDRFGIKPLYVYEEGSRVYFASELKAIVAVAPGARTIDEGTLARFLVAGVQDDGPRTFFAGVRSLAPGRCLELDVAAPGQEAGRRERAYWSFDREAARARYDYGDPARTLRGLLDEAVALRLRSDVPVGTCLSGGLDSSSVVGLAAARRAPDPVRTFTAVYDDRGYDERSYARAVVERFGCQAAEVQPRPGTQLVELIDAIGWYHDEPCARPGLITQWYVMSLAAGQVTVLLDGQGGDEVLLGYVSYALPYLRSLGREALRHPSHGALLKLWRDGHGLLTAPSTSPDGPGSLLGHLAKAGLRRLRRQRPPALAPALLEAMAAVEVERTPRGGDLAGIDRLMRDELVYQSIPALLHHEDRTSMAFGLEARVPFLDVRLVEFALGLDFKDKVEGPYMKSVLRRAMRGTLPDAVLDRRDKLGYPTPIARWLREGGPDVQEALLGGFAERGLIAASHVEAAWSTFSRGGGDPWLLYRWLTVEVWLRRFLDRPPAPPLVGPHAPGLAVPRQLERRRA